MASFRQKGKNWFYRFVDADGRKRERKGCPDRRVTEAMAAAAEMEAVKVRAGLLDPRDLAFRAHEATPLADHLAAFRDALAAEGNTRGHVGMTFRRAERVLNLAKVRRISELSLSKALGALPALRDAGLNKESVNHHIRAVKAFSRWLWKDGRAREHALAHLSTSNPESDRRRVRRALTPEEAARLILAAEQGPVVQGLSGPDRADLYALTLGTGFRAEELASLTFERFDLESDPPTVTVRACYSKNGREAVQPISEALAGRLRPRLARTAPGAPVFNRVVRRRRTAEMLRVDLEAAGIAYKTDSGVVDFHALRTTYVSHLVATGASVKTCQVLARHATPTLTIGCTPRRRCTT
jgi:integrase